MSEDGENKGGGIATTVGVLGGGAVAAGISDHKMLNKGITKALAEDATAPKAIADKVNAAITKTPALGTEKTALQTLKGTAGADKTAILKAEQALTKNTRAAGSFKMGNGLRYGFNGLSKSGKATVIGGTVAAAVVGGIVFNKLFGGQHTKRIDSERQVQADLGRV